MKSFAAVLVFAALPLLAFAQSDASGPLPFAVKIGGEAAQTKAGAAFASIEKAVPADAAIEIGTKGADMSIINVVAADAKGTPKEGATPAVLIIQSGTTTTLAKTMDKQKLAPGNYLMSIVAEGKTASISLQVQ
jgi:hypothetical protein